MKCLHVFKAVIYLMLSGIAPHTMARNVQATVYGGEVHLNGSLVNGGCAVAANSRDMHIDMGHYTPHSFDQVGALSTHSVPLTIWLTGCVPEIANKVGITFSGMTAPKAPDLFLVTSAEGGPTGVSGDNGFSGLGLMISDMEGHQIIPSQPPAFFYSAEGSDVILHYVARYRATSRGKAIYPGPLSSQVRFDISYP